MTVSGTISKSEAEEQGSDSPALEKGEGGQMLSVMVA